MSDGPIFSSRLALPMAWEVLSRAPTLEDCTQADWTNAGIFAFLLQSVDLEAAQRPADERLAEALAPLRIKLDIMMEMLGRLTYRDVAVPPVCDIELAGTRLAWQSPTPLRHGDWLRLKLYFDSKFLEPIVLYAQVTSAVNDPASGGCGVQAELVELPAETEEAFARLAFLAQRRQLAQRPSHARIER